MARNSQGNPTQRIRVELSPLLINETYTQDEVAQKSGMTTSGVVFIERGINSPRPRSVKRIAEVLGVSAEVYQQAADLSHRMYHLRRQIQQAEALNQEDVGEESLQAQLQQAQAESNAFIEGLLTEARAKKAAKKVS